MSSRKANVEVDELPPAPVQCKMNSRKRSRTPDDVPHQASKVRRRKGSPMAIVSTEPDTRLFGESGDSRSTIDDIVDTIEPNSSTEVTVNGRQPAKRTRNRVTRPVTTSREDIEGAQEDQEDDEDSNYNPDVSSRSQSPAPTTAATSRQPSTSNDTASSTATRPKKATKWKKPSTVAIPKPPYPCPSDCASFDDAEAFRYHMETLHPDDYLLCRHAECAFSVAKSRNSNMTLSKHYRLQHAEVLLKCTAHPNCLWKGSFDPAVHAAHVESHKLRCHFCLDENQGQGRYPFESDDALEAHILTNHSTASIPCGGLDFVTGKPCERRFMHERSRSCHMNIAHREEHRCPYCTQDDGTATLDSNDPPTFPSLKSLALHVKSNHPGDYSAEWSTATEEKSFPCPHCSKTFNKNNNLQQHIKSVHLKSRPFVCGVTDLSSSSRMIDDSGSPIVWDDSHKPCGVALSTKQSLIDHVRATHFGLLRWEMYKKAKEGGLLTRRNLQARKRMNKDKDTYGGSGSKGAEHAVEKRAEAAGRKAQGTYRDTLSILTGVGKIKEETHESGWRDEDAEVSD